MNASPPVVVLAEFGSVLRWFNVNTPFELIVVVFGVGAQSLFFGRWIVQWLATERRGEPCVPVAFWWLSLAGASALFLYYALRREPVGMLSQSIGWVIYSRNLVLLRRRTQRLAARASPPADPSSSADSS